MVVVKPCDVCGMAMRAYQRVRHYSCCAASGGREPICNPTAKPVFEPDGSGFKRCEVFGCWRRGEFVRMLGKRDRAKS